MDESLESSTGKVKSPLVRIALDLGPVVTFFATYYLTNQDIITATAVFIPVTLAALVAGYVLEKKLSPMPVVTAVVVVVFGGLTIYLDDKLFIMLKPTIVNGIFAAILFGGVAMGRPILKYLLGEVYKLPDHAWRALTIRWAVFFVVLAVLNEIVRLNFSEAFWVTFKAWGVLPLTLVFVASQVPFILRHQEGSDGDPTPVKRD